MKIDKFWTKTAEFRTKTAELNTRMAEFRTKNGRIPDEIGRILDEKNKTPKNNIKLFFLELFIIFSYFLYLFLPHAHHHTPNEYT